MDESEYVSVCFSLLTVYVPIISISYLSQNPHIRRAISNCIKPDLNKVSDTYSLNILAYTMSKAGYTKELGYLLTKLDILAITESMHLLCTLSIYFSDFLF